MSQRFAIVYEDDADFRTATELADRVLVEVIGDWLDEDLLTHQREWFSEAAGGRQLTWKGVKRLAAEARIRAHGHFEGRPGEADAAAARRAILYLKEAIPNLNAIVLVRDQDDQPERRFGLEQARGQDRGGTVIVVGLAVVEREAWVISGFDPQSEEETARLDAERQTLGFDPRHRSHELTACKDRNAKKGPKRVLQQLSGDDRERERQCWISTHLAVLRERGGENGLAFYLQEVQDWLAPLIGHVARGRGDSGQSGP